MLAHLAGLLQTLSSTHILWPRLQPHPAAIAPSQRQAESQGPDKIDMVQNRHVCAAFASALGFGALVLRCRFLLFCCHCWRRQQDILAGFIMRGNPRSFRDASKSDESGWAHITHTFPFCQGCPCPRYSWCSCWVSVGPALQELHISCTIHMNKIKKGVIICSVKHVFLLW